MKKAQTAASIIFLALVLLLNGMTNVSAEDIQRLQEQQEQTRLKTRTARDFLEDTQNEKSGVQAEVAALDAELDEAFEALTFIETELADAQERLTKTRGDLAEAENLKGIQYEAMKARMRYMYENSPSGYLSALTGAVDFADFINRLEYVSAIVEYDREQFNRYKQTIARIDGDVLAIEDELTRVETLKARQLARLAQLEERMAEKEAALSTLYADETAFTQQIADLERESEEIETLIAEAKRVAEEKARREQEERERQERERKERERIEAEAKAAAARAAAQAAKEAQAVRYTGGALGWPVPGYYELSSGYGSRTSPISGKKETHTGIDIPAPQGTPIYAAAGGTVIMSQYNGGYGYCVIIDHGGGLATLYGHNSKLLVSVGDSVSKGDKISLCGTTGYSTGPHCHFEVRLDGKHTSPLPYLSD